MLSTRYEDYTGLCASRPFVMHQMLSRTPLVGTGEANWHENLELQLVEEGEGYVLLDGEKIFVKKGDFVLINSNVIHYTSSDTKIVYSCLIISSKFCVDAEIDHSRILFSHHFRDESILRAFEKTKEAWNNTQDICRTARLQSLVLSILILAREKYTVAQKSVESGDKNRIVRLAIKYITEHYSEKITLDKISKSVLSDKYTLCREFKKITGKSVVEYVNIYRCQKAAEQISEGESVFVSARNSGFNNMSFFTKTFKRYMGVLPSKFRL